MPKVCYEEMLPHEIVAARQAKPLAYLPIGTIEWHGLQNPLGLDALKARALCVQAAEAGGGLAFPPLWWGEHREIQLMETSSKHQKGIAQLMQLPVENFKPGYMKRGTVKAQADFYCDLLLHVYRQIESLGFKGIFILCGHYPLQMFTDYTSKLFMAESPVRVFGSTEAHLVGHMKNELGGAVGDHAARWETSLLMALCPDMVDLTRLPQEPDAKLVGISGEDPRKSSLEFGEKGVAAIVKRMIEIGDNMLNAYATTKQRFT